MASYCVEARGLQVTDPLLNKGMLWVITLAIEPPGAQGLSWWQLHLLKRKEN